jgi:hypothetical protein
VTAAEALLAIGFFFVGVAAVCAVLLWREGHRW